MTNQRFQNSKENRKPAYANTFYPGSKSSLNNHLDELFLKAVRKINKLKPLALIAPHAGYVFSGKVAASAYTQIPDNVEYERVFVLASSHNYRFKGAALYDAGNYETPLGEIEVDTKLASKLIESNKVFFRYNEAHINEHSLEVQLPFLQYKLKNKFMLVPVILGTDNYSDCQKIAKALEPWFKPENLFVVSTDFSHYPSYQDAINNDLVTAQAICLNDPDELLSTVKSNERKYIRGLATSLCGWTSVLSLIYMTQDKDVYYQKIDYQNSGDSEIYGDRERVVGYWAIAVFEREKAFSISREEQKELLEKARNAISYYVQTGKIPNPEPPVTGGVLKQKAGVFVSIYVDGDLRGCIGNFASDLFLNDLVQKMAVSAACDYRFDDLNPEELGKMKLEISVLSPLKKIKNIDEIQLGKHGIYIKKDLNSGTFLPQVADKTGWDLTQFLGHCSRDKAGLGWDGWKEAELYTYEAFVFKD